MTNFGVSDVGDDSASKHASNAAIVAPSKVSAAAPGCFAATAASAANTSAVFAVDVDVDDEVEVEVEHPSKTMRAASSSSNSFDSRDCSNSCTYLWSASRRTARCVLLSFDAKNAQKSLSSLAIDAASDDDEEDEEEEEEFLASDSARVLSISATMRRSLPGRSEPVIEFAKNCGDVEKIC